MSIIKSKKIMGKQFSIYAESWSNSRAWGHKAVLKINDYQTWENKIRYYNRTWERYQYESVIHSVIYDYIEYIKELVKENFKREKGIKRITEKYKKEVEKAIKTDKNIKAVERFKKYIDKEYIHSF